MYVPFLCARERERDRERERVYVCPISVRKRERETERESECVSACLRALVIIEVFFVCWFKTNTVVGGNMT